MLYCHAALYFPSGYLYIEHTYHLKWIFYISNFGTPVASTLYFIQLWYSIDSSIHPFYVNHQSITEFVDCHIRMLSLSTSQPALHFLNRTSLGLDFIATHLIVTLPTSHALF